jgi:DNA-directed RNA polymerase subunit D
MKLKVAKKKDERIEFNVSGIKENIANALRRVVISDVPVLAIETVTFTQNSSVMDDEVLAHRLGLIPLKTEADGLETLTLSLEGSGPGVVYSKNLKVKETKAKGKKKSSESISVYDTIPVIKLTEGQKVEFEATAQLGRGRDHIKWQAGIASYDKKDDGSFDFFIESYGQMPLAQFVDTVFENFNGRIKELKTLMKK